MSETQNRELVQRGYELFKRGDIMGVLSLFDDDITWNTPGPQELPLAGSRRGHGEVLEFFTTLANLVDTERMDVNEFIAQGDRVVVIGENASRVKATGKLVTEPFVHTFTVRNGKVVAFQEYMDSSQMVAALRGATTGA